MALAQVAQAAAKQLFKRHGSDALDEVEFSLSRCQCQWERAHWLAVKCEVELLFVANGVLTSKEFPCSLLITASQKTLSSPS